MSLDDHNSLADSAVKMKNKKCGGVFIEFAKDVRKARSQGKVAFYSWKLLEYLLEGEIHETYCAFRKEYECEANKIAKF